jgi:predicted 3-demethylubiquinone-9 3-methyltransferase (glyoxalase superfamily)
VLSILNTIFAFSTTRERKRCPKITPFLWFDDQAEEAATFYISIFPNARILDVTRYAAGAPGPAGQVMTVNFALDGQEFIALNGGPEFEFTEAVSFVVDCQTQEEMDRYWYALSNSGEEGPCGWLKDRYGLSWQIVPTSLSEMLQDADSERAQRVTAAFLQMKKLDIQALQDAFE